MENSEANCLLGKSTRAHRHMSMLRQRVVASEFESFLWGMFSRFPLDSHLALPGSKSVFVLSPSLSLCVQSFLSKDGF